MENAKEKNTRLSDQRGKDDNGDEKDDTRDEKDDLMVVWTNKTIENETSLSDKRGKDDTGDQKDDIMSVWANKTIENETNLSGQKGKDDTGDQKETDGAASSNNIAPPMNHLVTFEDGGRASSPPKAVVTFDERPSSAITFIDEMDPEEPKVEYESDSDVSYEDDNSRKSFRSLIRLDSDLSLMHSKTFTKDDIGSVVGGHMDTLLELDSMKSSSSIDISSK